MLTALSAIIYHLYTVAHVTANYHLEYLYSLSYSLLIKPMENLLHYAHTQLQPSSKTYLHQETSILTVYQLIERKY